MLRIISGIMLAGMICTSGIAGVVVNENVAANATNWPGSPLIYTMTNPAVQSTVGEGFNSAGGCTNYAETFTITTGTCSLQTISLYAGQGDGTGTGGPLMLRLFDLGTQTAPNPSAYTPGTDLFNSGNGLSISYTPQTEGVLEFDFTDVDQVTLQSGHMYAFEIEGEISTLPVVLERATNDSYSGGAAYRNRSWINGNNARDFALAVYQVPPSNGVISGRCTVNWSNVNQRIDGFGGGVVFLDGGLDPMTTANMNSLYGTNNASQLGLTLLRVRIDPTTNWTTAIQDGQKAVAHGAGVLATPWTPPAWMKDSGQLTNGGSVIPTNYAAYASYLKMFAAAFLASNGVPLRAISIQNEPDFTATYESCRWNSSQFLAFFQTNLGTFTNLNIVMPESESFTQSISDPTLNDSSAVTNVSIVAGHLYGNAPIVDYHNAHNHGIPTWMTEYLVNDQTINTAIDTAKQIHDCLTVGNMSAYIWWKCIGDANGLLNAAGAPQYRGFVMAQFSRFVRPGYFRIGVTSDITPVSAYQDTNSGSFAIVAINTNAATSVLETFALTNFAPASVTPWITSGSQTLAVQTAVTVSNGTFNYTLPALSVVTFVGRIATNSPPVFTAVPNQTVNAGTVLAITNTATDPNQPLQNLSFALLTAPSNASLVQLDNNDALFSWRPLVSQAGATNSIQVQVTDSGSPALSATNSFTITINPLAPPNVSAISFSGTQAVLTVTGTQGPDYSLWGSTNLTDWQIVGASNSPAIPVTFIDTNVTGYPTRFYRIQIGP